jgi:hypothetical protein
MPIYTPSTEPAVGTVVYTTQDAELNGNGTYIFDAEGYPVSFSQQQKVTSTPRIYNGEREMIDTDGDPKLERQLEEQWGPGPWFYIKLDAGTPVVTIDTYTYTISYNK